jgi:hypothetical protein
MRAWHPNSSSATVITAALLLFTGARRPAEAAVQGRAQSATAAVSSGTWGAVATTATTAPYGTAPMSLSFPALSVSARFFTVGNTGTLTVTAATYTASSSNGLVTVKIEACNSGWNETANSCSGLTMTVLDTAVSSTASAAFSTSSSLPSDRA